jgi:hypothetical protein
MYMSQAQTTMLLLFPAIDLPFDGRFASAVKV